MATDERLTKSVTLIKDLRPGLKNVTCVFIVIDKGSTNHTKDGSVVRKCRVADKSASVCFSLWNEQASAIEGGDILRLTKGYTSLWKGSMVLYSGKYGRLEKIGEFNMLYSETPDMSTTTQDFVQRGGPGAGQQQPPPNPPTGRPPDLRGPPTSSSPANGRTGPSGNWNGNNHIGDSKSHDATTPHTSSSVAGHMIHEPNHVGMGNGYPSYQKPPNGGHYDQPPHPHKPVPHPHHSASNSYHPYHRPPPASHIPDTRSGWR